MKQAEYRIKDEVINQLRKIVWAQAVEQVKEQIRRWKERLQSQ